MIIEKVQALAGVASVGVGSLWIAQQVGAVSDLPAVEQYGAPAVLIGLLVWLLRVQTVGAEKRLEQIHSSRVQEAVEFARQQTEALAHERAFGRQVYTDLMQLLMGLRQPKS